MSLETSAAGGAWSNRNFRRLWTGFTVSTFGSEVAEIALPLLALLTLSASAAQVGLLRVAAFVPFLLATLPLGVLVDRHRQRRLALMMGADVGRFALFAVIPIMVWAGVASVWMLYIVLFGAGVLTVLYQVADFAFLPDVVRRDQLVDANGKISASQSANEVGGRGFGALLVQAISAPVAIAVNAVSFLGSAISLHRIHLEPYPIENLPIEPALGAQSSMHDIAEGLRIAVRNRYVRALLGEATTFNVFNEMFILGLLLYAVRDRGVGVAAIGLIFSAGGVGSFIGAWFGARMTGRFGYGHVLQITLIIGNSAPLGVALSDAAGTAVVPLLCGVFVIMGVGIGVANVHAVSLRQTALPEALRGRVNAAYRLISWGAIPIGATVGGLLATNEGAKTTMITGSIGMALATLWVVFSAVPRLRTIDDVGLMAFSGTRTRTRRRSHL
jgi:MFS family permease